MSGIEEYNYPAFNAAAKRLRSLGYTVFNPAETFGGDASLRKEQYLAIDYPAVQVCDTVVMLPSWERSQGAKAERAVAESFGIPIREYREVVNATQPRRAIIGLVGYAGSGKDEVAKILCRDHGFHRIAFADPLKAIAKSVGWNGAKDDAGRRLLQDLGMAVREHIGRDTWLNCALRLIDECTAPVVITDCRFSNEIKALRERGGVIWRVDRPEVGPVNDHVSEYEWTLTRPCAIIENSSTIKDLEQRVERVMRIHGEFETAEQG